MVEETAYPTFDIQKSFDAQRQVWTITLFTPSGERLCSVEASPFGVIVNGAPGSFFPIGQFGGGSTRDAAEAACPHCGNAEGNVGRPRCFICNREI